MPDATLQTGPTDPGSNLPSDKSRGVALALAVVLGLFGGHRFYLEKPGTGALMALTMGGLGIWWLYDLILIASGSFRDVNGRLVRRWDPEEPLERNSVPAEVLEEIDFLRRQVAELAERVDFTERVLAAPRPEPDLQHSPRSAARPS